MASVLDMKPVIAVQMIAESVLGVVMELVMGQRSVVVAHRIVVRALTAVMEPVIKKEGKIVACALKIADLALGVETEPVMGQRSVVVAHRIVECVHIAVMADVMVKTAVIAAHKIVECVPIVAMEHVMVPMIVAIAQMIVVDAPSVAMALVMDLIHVTTAWRIAAFARLDAVMVHAMAQRNVVPAQQIVVIAQHPQLLVEMAGVNMMSGVTRAPKIAVNVKVAVEIRQAIPAEMVHVNLVNLVAIVPWTAVIVMDGCPPIAVMASVIEVGEKIVLPAIPIAQDIVVESICNHIELSAL